MLKHVQISPLRSRADSLSLRSTTSCASSICGSPELVTVVPRTPSRASSYSSLNDQLPQTTIKVYTNCLKIDIEYKTLGIQWDTTSKDVIMQLLRRLKMRHRDPRLFYLLMEVSVRRVGIKTVLVLDDDTRPAILQACHPKGESRFCLQLKPGGLIRVHTSALQPSSQYKSLVISEETTSDELLQLLLSCYNSIEPVEQFSIYEVCPGQEYQRKLHPDDLPLRAQVERAKRGESCHFLVRRNPNYLRRRQILATLDEVVKNYNLASNTSSNNESFDSDSSLSCLETSSNLLDISIDSLSDDLQSLLNSSGEDDVNLSSDSGSSEISEEAAFSPQKITASLSILSATNETCRKSCCYKSMNTKIDTRNEREPHCSSPVSFSYNPVYNVREIKRISHTFSSLGSDKKFIDFGQVQEGDLSSMVRLSRENCRSYNNSPMILDATNPHENLCDINDNKPTNITTKTTTTLAGEEVNNDPAKGLGHFVYI